MSVNLTVYQKEMQILKINSFLNRKIIQNEMKLKTLFNDSDKKRKCYSTDKNNINIEKYKNKKPMKIKMNKKIIKNYKTDFYNSFDERDKERNKNNNHSQNLSPRNISNNGKYNLDNDIKLSNKKNHIKVNKKLINKSNDGSGVSHHISRNKILSPKNKKINKLTKKYKPKPKSKPKLYNKLNNSTILLKDNSTNDYSCKSERFLSPSTKSVNFEEMIERFKNEEKKRKEWIEKEKKKEEEKEKQLCSSFPKINENSRKINLKIQHDFLKRQRIKELEKKRREDNLSIYLNKKKEEEINKTNYLLQKNKIGKSKEKNLNNSNSMISNKTYDKNKKEKISNVINKLYEWNSKRKEKIELSRKKNDEKVEKIIHIPRINKRSASMAELKKKRYNEKNIFKRLAKEDPEMIERKKILVDLYTPSFKPNIYTQKNKKTKNKDGILESEDNKYDSKRKETTGITSISKKYINDDKIQELYRKAIFHK